MSTVLVTGGTGYIGSHTCVELLNNGYDIIIVDNFCNSNPNVAGRIEQIAGKKVKLYKCDLCYDVEKLDEIFKENKIDAVMHFAGLKSVSESIKFPILKTMFSVLLTYAKPCKSIMLKKLYSAHLLQCMEPHRLLHTMKRCRLEMSPILMAEPSMLLKNCSKTYVIQMLYGMWSY